MTQRLSDWETRLAAYLAIAADDVRAGRKNYCALFGAGAVEAVTGEDPTKAFRGKYSQVADALEETIDSLFSERPIALARRGDLAWHDGAVGVIIGGEALFVGHHENGQSELTRVPRREWAKAWEVGA